MEIISEPPYGDRPIIFANTKIGGRLVLYLKSRPDPVAAVAVSIKSYGSVTLVGTKVIDVYILSGSPVGWA